MMDLYQRPNSTFKKKKKNVYTGIKPYLPKHILITKPLIVNPNDLESHHITE